MSNLTERYASAIRSSNLKIDDRTARSDSDVLGAMGLAAIRHPLAVALHRLFAGDNTASVEIVDILSDDAWKQARAMRVRLNRQQAKGLAQSCLAWHRNPVCKICDGHGRLVIPGTKTLRDLCGPCRGTGRTLFADLFPHEQRELANWVIVHMETHQAQAGPEAMRKIAEYLNVKHWLTDQLSDEGR
ncbi:hypothetical protein J2W35_004934 [Variovorax boronicumulans]|uniref:hypothetical protein n=1 Tax=Variovorax boronicumulans TaxID=436515 RepID=UPI00278A8F89|nr:hypothetical protein [Variovorax boronicumulans]MDQ0084565.1 hypothetical protein [Variovorax boronicumulans]